METNPKNIALRLLSFATFFLLGLAIIPPLRRAYNEGRTAAWVLYLLLLAVIVLFYLIFVYPIAASLHL